MNLQEVLSHFDGVKSRNENEYMVRCPCHDDKKQSLCIGSGEKGVVLKCQAGCDTRAILDRVGLKPADLFFEKKQNSRPQVTATYQYPNGVQKLRRSDKSFTWRRPDGKGGWIYNRKGVPHNLYIAGELSEDVAITEGERTRTTYTSWAGQRSAAKMAQDRASGAASTQNSSATSLSLSSKIMTMWQGIRAGSCNRSFRCCKKYSSARPVQNLEGDSRTWGCVRSDCAVRRETGFRHDCRVDKKNPCMGSSKSCCFLCG